MQTARTASATQIHGLAGQLSAILAGLREYMDDPEALDRQLTRLENQMLAAARPLQTEQQLHMWRREFESQLQSHREQMSAELFSMVEQRCLDTRLLEFVQLPRLSLFYIR